jgi:hypothetical protein
MITTSATLQNCKKREAKKALVATKSCYGLIVFAPFIISSTSSAPQDHIVAVSTDDPAQDHVGSLYYS